MNMIQPSRLTFWRFLFSLTGLLSFLAVLQIIRSVADLGVDLSASAAWMGFIALLSLIGSISFALLVFTWSRNRERILSRFEFPERITDKSTWMGILPVAIALTGFTVLFMLPFVQSRFGGLGWIRFLI